MFRPLRTLPYVAAYLLLLGASSSPILAGDAGTFVDEAQCASCHPAQASAWQGSHHDLAMQEATEASVLGDFSGRSFSSHGLTTRFTRDAERHLVTADGPDGQPARFDVRYVLGVVPLQQYLLSLPFGRLQALSVAWDARGERWFHLYPDETIDFRDELHWTKPAQNWNVMCAECHSTDVDKNYDEKANRYETRWFQIDVGCQACHGPGHEHVLWATAGERSKRAATRAEARLAIDLAAADNRVQIEACARCHSRRGVIAPEYEHGRRLLDTHLPALLEERLYHHDGQIRDEVYEYGSFLQSKMASKGMRCSDCHDAHSGQLRLPGNGLCVTCHNAGTAAARRQTDTSRLERRTYDSPEHHSHRPGEPGSQCVDCHAPPKAFMVIDERADHSFRIPRPDLSARIGTPNPCTACHADQTPRWAADAIREHAPAENTPADHFGLALYAGRRGEPGAAQALLRVARQASLPAIARATALVELRRYPGQPTFEAFARALGDDDPLLRRVAIESLEQLPPPLKLEAIAPLLDDPVLGVRIEAARVLAPFASALNDERRERFESALAELEASHRVNADRPEGRLNRGNLYVALGQLDTAIESFRSALALEPDAIPAAVNLADTYRLRGEELEADAVLRQALKRSPHDATLKHALALSLVRRGEKDKALRLLASAAAGAPDRAATVFAHAVSLADAGRRDEASAVLEAALESSRGDRNVLLALAAFHRDSGNLTAATAYLEQLRAINPYDPAFASEVGR